MSTQITRDDWLKALNDIGYTSEHDEHAITVREFASTMQVSTATATRQLQALEKAGKAKRTQKHGPAADGRTMRLLAYRLL